MRQWNCDAKQEIKRISEAYVSSLRAYKDSICCIEDTDTHHNSQTSCLWTCKRALYTLTQYVYYEPINTVHHAALPPNIVSNIAWFSYESGKATTNPKILFPPVKSKFEFQRKNACTIRPIYPSTQYTVHSVTHNTRLYYSSTHTHTHTTFVYTP